MIEWRDVEYAAASLAQARNETAKWERLLQHRVMAYLAERPEGTREQARAMKLSAAYLSDIRLGRREISESFLKRLHKLAVKNIT